MGRVFTLSFRFKDKPCTALVSMNSRDYNLSFNVHYLDKEVEEILPQRQIAFSLANGIENPENINNKMAEDLVHETSEAISNYMKVHL